MTQNHGEGTQNTMGNCLNGKVTPSRHDKDNNNDNDKDNDKDKDKDHANKDKDKQRTC